MMNFFVKIKKYEIVSCILNNNTIYLITDSLVLVKLQEDNKQSSVE
jgi:hypothetical protein